MTLHRSYDDDTAMCGQRVPLKEMTGIWGDSRFPIDCRACLAVGERYGLWPSRPERHVDSDVLEQVIRDVAASDVDRSPPTVAPPDRDHQPPGGDVPAVPQRAGGLGAPTPGVSKTATSRRRVTVLGPDGSVLG